MNRTVPALVGWLLPVSATWAGAEFLERPSPQTVRILCYNVNWDSIFPDDDPDNHPFREFDMGAPFVRVVQAVQADIVCLQEINSQRDPQDVADILNDAAPLGDGTGWRVHRGSDNVIASRFNLSLQRTDTTPSTNRGQAMALVDLPDANYSTDLYLMNAHFKAGGSDNDIVLRQRHADAVVNWMRDIKSPGGHIHLPTGTPMIVLGDLNVYDTDPAQHLTTLLSGDIIFESTFGPNAAPDWDGTSLADALPLHNAVGPDTYTWRNDADEFNPGALDRILYTDSVMSVAHSFVLNTVAMSPADRAAAGLLEFDVVLHPATGYYDHLPLVVDIELPMAVAGDFDGDGDVDGADFVRFADCMAGPGLAPAPVLAGLTPSGCLAIFDMNDDSDVDLADWVSIATN